VCKFLGTCFESTSQIPTSIYPVVRNVISVYLCQHECQRRENCSKFVYDNSTQNCYLSYLNPGTKIVLADAIIGPRSCEFNDYLGKQINQLIAVNNLCYIIEYIMCFIKFKMLLLTCDCYELNRGQLLQRFTSRFYSSISKI